MGYPRGLFFPSGLPTNYHPDSKSGPGASCHLHHEVNVHTDAHQWEKRQSRYLGQSKMFLCVCVCVRTPQGDLERDP